MKISKHIHFFQNPDSCYRYELKFEPPIEIESTLGKVKSFYLSENMKQPGSKKLETVANILNENSIIDIREPMKTGETLSVEIGSNYRLENIVFDLEHHYQLYIYEQGFMYWFTTGKDGVFALTANLVKDTENYFSQIRSGIKDIAMRDYVKRLSLANSDSKQEKVEEFPEVMSHAQAAKFLGISKGTLYNNREVPRMKGNRYSKNALLKYLTNKGRK